MTLVQLRGGPGPDRFDVSLPGGIHAIVGARDPWASEIVEAMAGLCRPRWLEVRVDGRHPYREPELRRSIGSLLPREDPGEGATVGAAMYPLFRLRGAARSPTDALAEFGLGAWVGRRTSSLSPLERRSVALAVALSLPAPSLLALHEPLVAGLERGQVVAALSRHAARGVPVVVVLSSGGDAVELGAQRWGLTEGRLFPAEGLPSAEVACFRVEADDARALAGALSFEAGVTHVAWDAARLPGHLSVQGTDPPTVALAVLRSAHRAGLGIRSIVRERPPRAEPRGPS